MEANFINRSRAIVKMSKPENKEVIGTVTGRRKREVTDPKSKELKEITDLCLNRQSDGALIAVAIDAGLRVALSSSDVQDGELIKINRGEQVDLGGGKRVNNYEIQIAE